MSQRDVLPPTTSRMMANANIYNPSTSANKKDNVNYTGMLRSEIVQPRIFSKSTAERLAIPKSSTVIGRSSVVPNKPVQKSTNKKAVKAELSTDLHAKSNSRIPIRSSSADALAVISNSRKIPQRFAKPKTNLTEKADINKKSGIIEKPQIRKQLTQIDYGRKGSTLTGGFSTPGTKKVTESQYEDDNKAKQRQQSKTPLHVGQRILRKIRTSTDLKTENDTLVGKFLNAKQSSKMYGALKTNIRTESNAKLKNAEKSKKMIDSPTEHTIEIRTKPPPRIVSPLPGMSSCIYCHRNFIDDRIEKHQSVCEKLANKRIKVYDSSKKRIKGMEVANNCETIISEEPKPQKANWRSKHKEFIAVVRAAKAVSLHLAKGGKITDLPPPPPSENPDYIQCPHCLRRFNEQAATRHIPKCVNILHNKPKPSTKASLKK